MSDCCSSDTCTTPITIGIDKHRCPVNKQMYKSVPARTVLHHVVQPWELEESNKTYYFCDDPECDVVYYSNDDSIITKSDLRTKVGIKSTSEDALICYCFGVTKAQSNQAEIKNFVIEQTKQGVCSCDTTNPSGKCCLKDFPK